MASQQGTVDYIVEQARGAGDVHAKRMFGEYGLYCRGKMVALVCDDELFVKPTAGGRAHAGALDEKPPYAGAKPCLVVPGERWDEGDWLAELFRISAAELPAPVKTRRARP